MHFDKFGLETDRKCVINEPLYCPKYVLQVIETIKEWMDTFRIIEMKLQISMWVIFKACIKSTNKEVSFSPFVS